jgi:hypothetical protein
MSEPDGTSDWCDALFVSTLRHFISSVSKTHTFNEPPCNRNYRKYICAYAHVCIYTC